MSSTAIPYLLILSAMFHALWNFLVKREKNVRVAVLAIIFSAVVFSALCLPFVSHPVPDNSSGLLWTAVAGLCEGGYIIALARAYETSSLGLGYVIMRGGAMFLVWLISSTLLHETLDAYKLSGALLVLAGLVFTQMESFRRKETAGLVYNYLAAAFVAGYHLAYGQALQMGTDPLFAFGMALFVSVLMYPIFFGKKIVYEAFIYSRQRTWPIVFTGLICATSFYIFLWALKHSAPGIAISLRNTSVVFAVILAYFARERVTARQWLGVLTVVAGSTLLLT